MVTDTPASCITPRRARLFVRAEVVSQHFIESYNITSRKTHNTDALKQEMERDSTVGAEAAEESGLTEPLTKTNNSSPPEEASTEKDFVVLNMTASSLSDLPSLSNQRRINHIFEEQAAVFPQQVAVEAPSSDLQVANTTSNPNPTSSPSPDPTP